MPYIITRRDKPLKMPHVIRHYAAGIKMEGASETKMAREIIRLRQTSVENSKSPYAELLVLNYFNRFISHKKAGMAMESSAENCRIMTKFHALVCLYVYNGWCVIKSCMLSLTAKQHSTAD